MYPRLAREVLRSFGFPPLIRRLGPARVAVAAVVAIVLLSGGTYAASRVIPLSSSSSKTPAPSSPTTGAAKAAPSSVYAPNARYCSECNRA